MHEVNATTKTFKIPTHGKLQYPILFLIVFGWHNSSLYTACIFQWAMDKAIEVALDGIIESLCDLPSPISSVHYIWCMSSCIQVLQSWKKIKTATNTCISLLRGFTQCDLKNANLSMHYSDQWSWNHKEALLASWRCYLKSWRNWIFVEIVGHWYLIRVP